LEPDRLVFQEDVLRDEVDADCWPLHVRKCTCSLPSKIS
jgi:hypothetical protein